MVLCDGKAVLQWPDETYLEYTGVNIEDIPKIGADGLPQPQPLHYAMV